MDANEFWTLIDEARADVADPSDAEQVVDKAIARLTGRPVPEIVGAAQAFWDVMAGSYRADLWGAAYQINGGCSDDGFEYFPGWLVVQGRATYEAVVADPDALAGLPVIRAAAASDRTSWWSSAQSSPTNTIVVPPSWTVLAVTAWRPQRSNGQVLTARGGLRHPSAVQPPDDQRAHGLPQDLKGQMKRVLTRQPLPESSAVTG